MGREARKVSPTGFYHIVLKGAGGQLIFEDDACRYRFLQTVKELWGRHSLGLIAWCLMDNHVHMLLDDPQSNLSHAIHGLATSYARYFNTKTGHSGPVFNERFKSVPILDDGQLLCCVRYIHNNPIKAGLATAQMYPWSSFRDYMFDYFGVTDTALVLDLFGGAERFYLDSTSSEPNPYFFKEGAYISDYDAREVACALIRPYKLHEIKALPKKERDPILVLLKSVGFRVEQISRLVDIGRNIVQRAKGDEAMSDLNLSPKTQS